MADKVKSGKIVNSHSVPCSPVTKQVEVGSFLPKTPIPTTKLKSPTWVKGAPTPILESQMTPNSKAIDLLVGFATGQLSIEEGELKHMLCISKTTCFPINYAPHSLKPGGNKEPLGSKWVSFIRVRQPNSAL